MVKDMGQQSPLNVRRFGVPVVYLWAPESKPDIFPHPGLNKDQNLKVSIYTKY
jgi:hypothetical protein